MTVQFRHPLVREVAYEQTLLRDRTRIHRWMLARLEEQQQHGLRGRADLLAEHAFGAEAWEKAANYMLRAGNEAFWRDAKTEAVRFLLRGLEAAEKSQQLDGPIGLQLHLELRNPLFRLARMQEVAHHLDAARPTALKLSHPTHTGRYHIFQSHYYWLTGDNKGALKEAESAQALAASNGLNALRLRAQFQRGLVQFNRGEHSDAIAAMEEVSTAIASREPQDEFGMNKSLLVTALGYSARANAELGRIPQAREIAARSLAIARELDNKFEWVFACVAEGWVNFRADDVERALPFLERACAICEADDAPLMAPVAGSLLSLALLGAGHADGSGPKAADRQRALTLAECAVKQGEEFRFGAFQPMRLAILSQALLANGSEQQALETAITALDRARLQGERVSEVEALIALSQARQCAGLDDQEPIRTACAIAERLDMKPSIARCRRLLEHYRF